MRSSPFSSRRAAADALLEREYDERRREVVTTVAGKLAAAGVRLDAADLDAAYNQAWHALHTKLAEGEEIDNHTGLLVAIAHRRALDEHRALRLDRRVEVDDLEPLATEHDLEQQLDDETRLRQFLASLRERLDDRELQAAALCYVYDYSRSDAARLIGVPPKRMEKIMDAVSRKLAPALAEIRSGTWCEQHRSLMTAYALGLLEQDGERYALARDHLRDCPSCRRSVLRTRGITAVARPVPLARGLALALLGRSLRGGEPSR
jgi:DNA-directed RNA polymerase specialized sigma24 family protein